MSGEYVCFLDVDDLWEPTFLEKLVALIEREQCDLVSCNYKKYDKIFYILCWNEKNVEIIKVNSMQSIPKGEARGYLEIMEENLNALKKVLK